MKGLVKPLWMTVFLALAIVAAGWPAVAQTVDEIIKRGKVIVGVNTTTPIFGLMGKDGEPEGYDPDVARLVGKYLGVPVEFVSVTGANRIPNLLSGRVDMVIALFGITPNARCRYPSQFPMRARPRHWSHPKAARSRLSMT
jgi:polar amino acid transport system substrate-binding protein